MHVCVCVCTVWKSYSSQRSRLLHCINDRDDPTQRDVMAGVTSCMTSACRDLRVETPPAGGGLWTLRVEDAYLTLYPPFLQGTLLVFWTKLSPLFIYTPWEAGWFWQTRRRPGVLPAPLWQLPTAGFIGLLASHRSFPFHIAFVSVILSPRRPRRSLTFHCERVNKGAHLHGSLTFTIHILMKLCKHFCGSFPCQTLSRNSQYYHVICSCFGG